MTSVLTATQDAATLLPLSPFLLSAFPSDEHGLDTAFLDSLQVYMQPHPPAPPFWRDVARISSYVNLKTPVQDDIGIGSADYDGFGLLAGGNPLDFHGPDKVSGVGALPIPQRAGSWQQPQSSRHFEQATTSFHSSSHTFGPGEPQRQIRTGYMRQLDGVCGTAIGPHGPMH